MTFKQKLAHIQQEKNTFLCVGLDPDPGRLPAALLPDAPLPERVRAFNRAIIQATAPFACAFKLNFAFFEAMGAPGWAVLEESAGLIPNDALTIADAKRGDIGNSTTFYARSVFETMDFDAITVAPYMGSDSISPFLAYPEKMAFILARTSNPGAADLQEQLIGEVPVYEFLVRQIAALPDDERERAGLVVGATSPEALARIRALVPGMPFLIPGVGAQGGDARKVMQAACDEAGAVLINSSRGIIYASDDEDFATAAGAAAKTLRDQLNEAAGK